MPIELLSRLGAVLWRGTRKEVKQEMPWAKDFRCGCGAGFETQAQLEGHARREHQQAKGFQCPCGAEFETHERLEDHARREHQHQ